MAPSMSFLAGFLGSLGVEVVVILNHFQQAKSLEGIPWQYKSGTYWVMRFLLALMGGALAAIYRIDNVILAIQIGASAPAFILAAAKLQSPVPQPPNPVQPPSKTDPHRPGQYRAVDHQPRI